MNKDVKYTRYFYVTLALSAFFAFMGMCFIILCFIKDMQTLAYTEESHTESSYICGDYEFKQSLVNITGCIYYDTYTSVVYYYYHSVDGMCMSPYYSNKGNICIYEDECIKDSITGDILLEYSGL